MPGPTLPLVIPANAGTHGHDVAEGIAQPLTTPQPWIPAFAGMTKIGGTAPVAPALFVSAPPRLRATKTFFASSRLRANAHNPRQKARHV